MLNYDLKQGDATLDRAATIDRAIAEAKRLSKDGAIIKVYDRIEKRVRARAWCGKAFWVKACTLVKNDSHYDCRCGGTGLLPEGPC